MSVMTEKVQVVSPIVEKPPVFVIELIPNSVHSKISTDELTKSITSYEDYTALDLPEIPLIPSIPSLPSLPTLEPQSDSPPPPPFPASSRPTFDPRNRKLLKKWENFQSIRLRYLSKSDLPQTKRMVEVSQLVEAEQFRSGGKSSQAHLTKGSICDLSPRGGMGKERIAERMIAKPSGTGTGTHTGESRETRTQLPSLLGPSKEMTKMNLRQSLYFFFDRLVETEFYHPYLAKDLILRVRPSLDFHQETQLELEFPFNFLDLEWERTEISMNLTSFEKLENEMRSIEFRCTKVLHDGWGMRDAEKEIIRKRWEKCGECLRKLEDWRKRRI